MRDNLQSPVQIPAINPLGWIKPTINKVQRSLSHLLKTTTATRSLSQRRIHDLLPPLAIVAGAIACGLWLESTAAGLLACIVLFFLAGIGKSLERVVSLMRTQAFTASAPGWRPSNQDKNQRDIYISSKAMERLRPWVEGDSSLTEESAKAYCSVLLDTLAMVNPKLAGESLQEQF